MGEIYKSPLRVYLLLGLLGLWGVLSGLSLPVSLFPNSSKPVIQAEVPYGDLTAEEFSKTYGNIIETQLKGLLIDGQTVENLEAHYTAKEAEYKIEFQWETDGNRALREVQTLMAALSASWPEDSRLSYQVEYWQENGGFLALSFYSPMRSLDDLYEELRPIMDPIGARVPDASAVGLFNPNRKHVEIIADPERLASLNLLPSDIENAVRSSNSSLTGGRLLIGEKQIAVEIPRDLSGLEGLKNLPIYTRSGVRLRLRDVATIQVVTNTKTLRQFKTSGVPSLILFANPKPGGNIKKMSDDIMNEVERLKSQMPSDVEFKVLVNPSEFINSSIKSVTKEVALAAGLAVIILLIFIGSLKNVITAAIEIPLSIIMAFIFMKLFNMNLNLISLGGLALSAGMNVDASVVVMENIFRHFDKAGSNLSADDRLKTVIRAVKEVWGPILASTVASLVVFVPLIMTSGLTNSILGDLAKAVIFSHAMSAVVALVLVPTVRLQMMKSETNFHLHSPIEKQFTWLENAYAKALDYFIRTGVLRWTTYAALVGVLAVLLIVVLPKLPKEIIGRPETDWVILGVSTPTFTEPRQLDQFTEKLEYDLLQKYQEETAYTFTQLNGAKNGMIMIRLKDRKNMDKIWKQLEENYVNSPTTFYWVEPWNPSELPIPNPPNMLLEVRGGDPLDRTKVAEDLKIRLSEAQVFSRIRNRPDSTQEEQIILQPRTDVMAQITRSTFSVSDLAQFVRVSTEGKYVGELSDGTQRYSMDLSFTKGRVNDLDQVKSLPLHLGGKIVPLSALADVYLQKQAPALFRYNQSEMTMITGRENESSKNLVKEKQVQAQNILAQWKTENPKAKANVVWTDPDKEISEALGQLKWALALSVLLVFVTMVLLFGDLVDALLVLVAIPLGMIGVLASLFVFKSTLSLNSVLGMILLNGIAVANSIILVDFMKKLVAEGQAPLQAAVAAAKARLRPILMTSMTTVLGMVPIALGFGEGGRILQPLGIAVAGGLWISMLLTIFVVPAMQATYLEWRMKQSGRHNKVLPWKKPEGELR